MPQAQIQSDLNAIATQQVPVGSQFDSQRYAIFYEPGTYGSAADPLVFQVGYHTQVAGLGAMPRDTVVNGAIDVFNNLCGGGSCNADDNFWRSLSNLTLNVDLPTSTPDYAPPAVDTYGAGCDNSAEMWAASQATPIRRAIINGSVVTGVEGAPAPVFTGQCQQNTVLSTSPVTEEEPFLYTDSGGGFRGGRHRSRQVPAAVVVLHRDSGHAGPADQPGARIRENLVLTPGVYNLGQPIVVSRPDTVVLGQGFATLVPQRGNAALVVLPGTGVKVSGLIVDAGPVNSRVLVSVGTPGQPEPRAADNPDLIQDVFFRIGGAETTATSATVSLLDNASGSIIDDVWAWRADHGNDVGWTANTGDTGLVVTGDDVTAYGLAVEHYQKSEVVWTGQGGTDVFFQNELPYDPPSQAAWMKSPTQVRFHNVFDLWIAGSGGLNSVINGTGGPATDTTDANHAPVDVTSYP
jgi:hypothetical protein